MVEFEGFPSRKLIENDIAFLCNKFRQHCAYNYLILFEILYQASKHRLHRFLSIFENSIYLHAYSYSLCHYR